MQDNINDKNQDSEILNNVVNWSFEHDELLSNWGDHASCYTWMHDATQRKFSKINMYLGIPVIILSTVSGTANFGISTIFPAGFSYGNAVIGTLSLITGVISTISNFLGYAQAEEAHRISAIQWSKFKRNIETELSLSPNERQNPSDFIKHNKAELDRLMEQSPIIPQDIINSFIKTFRKIKNVKMPEICNKLEPTIIYAELYDIKKTNLELKNNEVNLITVSDKSIVKSVSDKVNSFFTGKPTKSNNTKSNIKSNNTSSNTTESYDDNENNDLVINVKEENTNIINYSNASPIKSNIAHNPFVNNEKYGDEIGSGAAPVVVVPKEKVLPKQLVYGKK
jgi:hypothetical protein